MILGFDCSSIICGYCLLTDDGKYIDIGYINFKKCNNEFEKIDLFCNTFDKIIKENKANKENLTIFIEEAAQFFGKNSTAKTMSVLQRINGMMCACIYLKSGIKTQLVTAATARKTNGIKIPKGIKGKDTKRYIWTFVSEKCIIPNEVWSYGKKDNLQDHNFDMTDAFVVANYGVLIASSKYKHRESP